MNLRTRNTCRGRTEKAGAAYRKPEKEKAQAEAVATALNQKPDEQEAAVNQRIQTLKKDHAAEIEKALAIKEREMNVEAAERLRKPERENIRLQMENDVLRGSGEPGRLPHSAGTRRDARGGDRQTAVGE